MGILDDAIREHLELKRSHGASEEEVRRKEAEAFGPVRHDAAPAEADPNALDAEFAAPPAALDQPTEMMSHDELSIAAAADLEPLEAAPEDPYAVHPGDALLPDEDAPPAAEAGAGLLEPSAVEPGPPTPPDDHHDEQHPALADHDHIGREEHAPEPVFRPAAESPEPVSPPDAPLQPAPEDPYVGDPPVENPEIDEPPPRQSPEPADAHAAAGADSDAEDPLEETPEFLQDAPEHDRLWFEQKPPRDFDFGE